jgi:hypothetical protein
MWLEDIVADVFANSAPELIAFAEDMIGLPFECQPATVFNFRVKL